MKVSTQFSMVSICIVTMNLLFNLFEELLRLVLWCFIWTEVMLN